MMSLSQNYNLHRFKPILNGFKITHAKEKITLPYGLTQDFSIKIKVLKIDSYLSD
jgi:muramoyltetrapeptide carboxypeptidase LdcA involved in peptidoglycan recycling